MKRPALLTNALGLNNVDDPSRLVVSNEGTELAAAVNVDITPRGRIDRRDGHTRKQSGAYHSLWAKDSHCLVRSSDVLYRVGHDYSLESLYTGLTLGARMDFEKVGSTVYAGDGHTMLKITDSASLWTEGSYVGPTTSRSFDGPPKAHLLAFHGGRMLAAVDNYLMASEPFNNDLWRFLIHYPLDSRLRMLKPLDSGVWVSSETAIFWYGGTSMMELTKRRKFGHPAVEGTAVVIEDAGEVIPDLSGQKALLFLTTAGICLGGEEGFFLNLTKNKLTLPDGVSGGGVIVEKNYPRFVATIE